MNTQYIKHFLLIITILIGFTISIQAQQGGDYSSTIKSADEYYQAKDYYNAKAAYQLASKLSPEENYPKNKIAEIIDILKAEMLVRGDYDEFIEKGDEAFEAKNYSLASENYQNALKLISYEKYPQEQLDKAKNLNEAAGLKENIYKEAIASADKHFKNNDYTNALSFYRDAANVDPSKNYPKDQIGIINGIIQNQNSNQVAYEQAISMADQQLNYQKFNEALVQYEKALTFLPQDNYAIAQVAKMKSFVEKEKDYDRIASIADELYTKKDFAAAKLEYEKAQRVLPEKPYALNMINKINASLDEEQKKLAKVESDYQKAISEGNALFEEKKYQVAYSKFSKALDIKPDEKYPKDKLLDIDILLATGYLELSCFVHEDNKGLFDSRIQLIEDGRVLETAEIGTNGRHKIKLELNHEYQVKFYKTDYVQKIFDINTELPRDVNHNNIFEYDLSVELFQSCSTDLSLFDSPLTEITYKASKGNFYYDEDRARIIINKVKGLKQDCKEILKKEKKKNEYDEVIAKADKFLSQENYSKSLEKYSEAAAILPKQQYPKDKMTEIKNILSAADKYQALILSGDAKYNSKDYENALYDYYEAKNLKPKEAYPQEKIAEIDAIINAQKELDAQYLAKIKEADDNFKLDSLSMALSSYQAALQIKANEEYPMSQIAKIEKDLADRLELDKSYKKAIANADKLFIAEKLNDAKSAYLIASQIKPNEKYPQYKIEDINTIEEQRRIMALNDDYSSLIADADAFLTQLKYDDALLLYTRASQMKPKEEYPPNQIAKIKGLLVQIEADEQKYESLIANADMEFDMKEYAPSFDHYKSASILKPEKEYPKERMQEIENIMKELADLELAYNQAIQLADSQYDTQDWNSALASYQKASNLKLQETYPKERIAEINGIIQGLADADASYQAAIAAGDDFFKSSNWTSSLSSFQTALNIKPTEQYPQTKIAELNGIIEKLNADNAAYEQAIATADQLFIDKSYIDSKSNYEKALSIKADETYPKTKIEEIDALLKDMADQDALYAQYIENGDKSLGNKDYEASISQFKQAQLVKPQEAYPAEKIAEIEAILLAIADKDKAYALAITEGDQNRDIKSYEIALTKYEAALLIKPEEKYPQEQIASIKSIIANLAEQDKAYNDLISQADAKFDQSLWNDALPLYQKSLEIKANEAHPTARIQEINNIIQGIADKNANYNLVITEADAFYKSKTWESALGKYQEATMIKPNEVYPEEKIAELNGIIEKLNADNAAYEQAIATADQLFIDKSYIDSKSNYEKALSIKADEAYPKTKIEEIDALLKDIADQDALYAKYIASGDKSFGKKDYEASISQFKQAQLLKPQEAYPIEKIAEIEAILLAIADKDKAYALAITEGDQNRDIKSYEIAITKYEAALLIKAAEKYPQEQIASIKSILANLAEQDKAYNDLITQADAKFDQSLWNDALPLYQKSLEIKANEAHPTARIQEIKNVLQGIADKNADYNQAITEADAFYKTKTWESALGKYQEATVIKPNEVYPKEKIAELNTLLGDIATNNAKYAAFIGEADLLFASPDYEQAKLKYQAALELKREEAYPKEKIAEIETILARLATELKQYQLLIKEADKSFVKENWQPALKNYQNALAIKPAEKYPQDQIGIINAKLQEIAGKQASYDAFIAEADQLFIAQQYESSIQKYDAALLILPKQEYPKSRISEIKDLIATLAKQNESYNGIIEKADALLAKESYQDAREQYQLAINIFNDRPYPKEQIVIIDALIIKLGNYNNLIAQGDVMFKEKGYEESLSNFKQALVLFPKEYPQKKITEIETILSAIAMTQAGYNEAIKNGDAKFAINEYAPAKEFYLEALTHLSSEVYPRQKIMEIDQILQDIARKKVQYEKMIAQADASFKKQSYDMALGKYTSASEILPAQEYPKQKIAEINLLLSQIADQQTRYDGLVAQGDQAFASKDYSTCIDLFQAASAIFPNEAYPPQKIAEAQKELALIQRELDVAYQKAITSGDKNFNKRSWDDAKISYREASEIKPAELYPKEKLAEINSILEAELGKQQKQYDRHIADGERFYGTKYYQESIIAFEKALTVFPYEKYPVEMIDKIFELIKKNSMLSILDSKVQIKNNQKEKFTFKPIEYRDRRENYILLEIKMLNPEEHVKLFVNFGEGDLQKGGYSINLNSEDGYHSYFVNIGKQPRWVNGDNDYLSLLPEGGDVEVKLIKLSRNGI